MSSRNNICLLVVAVVLLLATSTTASTFTISTMEDWRGATVQFFGNPNSATYGQTIVAPTFGQLNSFSFLINLPKNVIFRGYVYEWSNTSARAVGSPLFQGRPMSTTTNSSFQVITFRIPNPLPLVPGRFYVMFASTSNDQISSALGEGSWGLVNNVTTSGGNFVYLSNGANTFQWTSTAWNYYGVPGRSAAFTAEFSYSQPPGPTPTPFPQPPPSSPTPAPAPFAYCSVPELLYYKFDGSGTSVRNYAPIGPPTATIMGKLVQGGVGEFGSGALIGSGLSSSTDFLNTFWATNFTNINWTISLYLRNIPPSSTLYYFFGDSAAGQFRAFTNGAAGASNLILRGDTMTDVTINNCVTVNANVAHFVYDGIKIQGYCNGVLRTSVTQLNKPIVSSTGPFKVMGYAADIGCPSGGVMDEFRVYNRALSSAEVASSWNVPCL